MLFKIFHKKTYLNHWPYTDNWSHQKLTFEWRLARILSFSKNLTNGTSHNIEQNLIAFSALITAHKFQSLLRTVIDILKSKHLSQSILRRKITIKKLSTILTLVLPHVFCLASAHNHSVCLCVCVTARTSYLLCRYTMLHYTAQQVVALFILLHFMTARFSLFILLFLYEWLHFLWLHINYDISKTYFRICLEYILNIFSCFFSTVQCAWFKFYFVISFKPICNFSLCRLLLVNNIWRYWFFSIN